MSKLEEFLNGLGLKLADDNPQAAQNITVRNQEPPTVDTEALVLAAVEEERNRVADLEALDCRDNAAVSAIIAEAKKNGKTANDIKPYIDAVRAVKPVQNAAQQLVADMVKDNLDSGVNGVGTDATSGDDEKIAEARAMDAMAQIMNKKFGGAK